MPHSKIKGVNIYWEQIGDKGEPLVLVHGSWGDHHNWDQVTGELSKTFRVLTYDRRGHSSSERPEGQGYVSEDVDDLIGLLEHLHFYPAHIAGNSFGAGIVLKTSAVRPDLFKSLIAHEPPLIGLLRNDHETAKTLTVMNSRIEAVLYYFHKGDNEKAAIQFAETIAFGPGSWENLTDEMRRTFIYNASTWYDEMQDPDSVQINLNSLKNYSGPALLSDGTQSPPFFRLVIDKIASAMPEAKRTTYEGAGHIPHVSHPEKYIETVKNFCSNVRKE